MSNCVKHIFLCVTFLLLCYKYQRWILRRMIGKVLQIFYYYVPSKVILNLWLKFLIEKINNFNSYDRKTIFNPDTCWTENIGWTETIGHRPNCRSVHPRHCLFVSITKEFCNANESPFLSLSARQWFIICVFLAIQPD